ARAGRIGRGLGRTATTIIRGFEMEAVVVFCIVGLAIVRRTWREGRLPLLGGLFLGGLVVAFVGDPIANWGLTALYSDVFFLLPRWMGWGLSPAQSWAVVFAYPWCFPMLAFAGRALAQLLGGRSPIAGFLCGALVGGAVVVLSGALPLGAPQGVVFSPAPPAAAPLPRAPRPGG